MLATAPDFDVLIVGAGISGIGMAAHMRMKLPDHTICILERREDIGGTWDLFRYPGVRSDSDMYTMGYEFEPWTDKETLASAERIKVYLKRVIDKYDIGRTIRFGNRVTTAKFDSETGHWIVTSEDANGQTHVTSARWLYFGAGYYNYDEPHDPGFDFSAFEGTVAHPQFWPEDLDYSGKKVVVIGSGATAITIVPVMAQTAKKVTMLQRTPTYLRSVPLRSKVIRFIRAVLPTKTAHKVVRAMNIRLMNIMFARARNEPDRVRANIEAENRRILGDKYREEHFSPPYNPWEQRMCFMPDGDLFEAIKADKAEVVTGHIDRFERSGIRLKDGRFLEADIIVTATGFELQVAGGVDVQVDGKPFVSSEHFFYKSAMLSDVPNLTYPVAYVNASATLRFDLLADYTCRVLKHMQETGMEIAVPVPPENLEADEVSSFVLDSGYVNRSRGAIPRSTSREPWKLSHDYLHDREYMRSSPIDDGVLQFRHAGAHVQSAEEQLEAAE